VGAALAGPASLLIALPLALHAACLHAAVPKVVEPALGLVRNLAAHPPFRIPLLAAAPTVLDAITVRRNVHCCF
jgi:hypothetical protein